MFVLSLVFGAVMLIMLKVVGAPPLKQFASQQLQNK